MNDLQGTIRTAPIYNDNSDSSLVGLFQTRNHAFLYVIFFLKTGYHNSYGWQMR
jgi:hypothetical protein